MSKTSENIEIAKLTFQLLSQSVEISPGKDRYYGLEPIVDPSASSLDAFDNLYRHLKTVLTEE